MVASTVAPKKKYRGGSRKGEPGHRQAANDKYHNYKVCDACGERKRLVDFALTGKWRKKLAADPTRYRRKCKKCTRPLNAVEVDPDFKPDRNRRVKRPRNGVEDREYAAAYKRRARRETRVKALKYLAEKGCCECGERDPRVLEFDHIEPREKKYVIAKLFSNGYSWGAEKLRAEIRKCRVICANCHRKHTIVQQEHYSHTDVRAALRQIFEDYGIDE